MNKTTLSGQLSRKLPAAPIVLILLLIALFFVSYPGSAQFETDGTLKIEPEKKITVQELSPDFVTVLNALHRENVIPQTAGIYYRIPDFKQDVNSASAFFYSSRTMGTLKNFVLRTRLTMTPLTSDANPKRAGCGWFFRGAYEEDHLTLIIAPNDRALLYGSVDDHRFEYKGSTRVPEADKTVPADAREIVLVVNGYDLALYVDRLEIIRKQNVLIPDAETVLSALTVSEKGMKNGVSCRYRETELVKFP